MAYCTNCGSRTTHETARCDDCSSESDDVFGAVPTLLSASAWLHGASGALAVASLYFVTRQRSELDEVERTGSAAALDALVTAEDTWQTTELMSLIALLAALALTITWTYQLYGRLTDIGAQDFRHRRGFAIGGWFIPFANLFLVPRILDDLERAARTRRRPIGHGWKEQRSSKLPAVWASTWVLSRFVILSLPDTVGLGDFDALSTIVNGRLALAVIDIAAATIVVVFTVRLRRQLLAPPEPAPPAEPTIGTWAG